MYGNRADNFRPLITLETSRRFVFTEPRDGAFSFDHAACSTYEHRERVAWRSCEIRSSAPYFLVNRMEKRTGNRRGRSRCIDKSRGKGRTDIWRVRVR